MIIKRYALAVVLAALLGGVRAADEVTMSAAQATALGVETAPLQARSGAEIAALPAQVVVPNAQLHVVATPLPGLVAQVMVAANAAVRRGQTLAQLHSPALAELQRGYAQSATQLQLAKENLQRDERLLAEGLIAESRYRAARSQHLEAAAAHAERRQALRLAGVAEGALGRAAATLAIVAPADGVILEQLVLPGERVDAAAPLFKVAALDPLWLEIQVPLRQLAGVAEGAQVRVAAAQAAGRVISVGRSVTASQTVAVRAEVSEGAQRLRPGQLVEVTLSAAGAKGWRVPNAALTHSRGRLLLFVRTPQGFRAQPVDLLAEGAADSTVGGALRGDEHIAVHGVAALKAALTGE